MTIRRDGWLAKWAYCMEKEGPPDVTSLCVLFWRSVFMAPVCVVGTLVVLVIASPVLAVLWLNEITRNPAGRIAGMVAATNAVSGIARVKRRVCPLIAVE